MGWPTPLPRRRVREEKGSGSKEGKGGKKDGRKDRYRMRDREKPKGGMKIRNQNLTKPLTYHPPYAVPKEQDRKREGMGKGTRRAVHEGKREGEGEEGGN